MSTTPVLQIDGLSVHYRSDGKTVTALDGVGLSIGEGKVLALVGESGCGKTTLGLSILGLLPDAASVVGGSIRFDGKDLFALPSDALRQLRGRQISMIFQDPMSGLNPVLQVGQQVEEIIVEHTSLKKREAQALVNQVLEQAGLSRPEEVKKRYPFELSGGMSQRVLIAIATALQPKLIIADEPTSALDVTVQAGILRQLTKLREERGVSMLLITHNLGVVAQMADEVAVLYAGRIAEHGSVSDVLRSPRHPYTWSLLAALPRLDKERRSLEPIRGAPPDQTELPAECAFLPRCRKATLECRTMEAPPLREIAEGHLAACYNPVAQE